MRRWLIIAWNRILGLFYGMKITVESTKHLQRGSIMQIGVQNFYVTRISKDSVWVKPVRDLNA